MTPRNFGHLLGRAAMFAAILIALEGQASAPPAAPSITDTHAFGRWTVRCYRAAGNTCDIAQNVVLPAGNARELAVSIAYVPGRNAYVGQFVVPLGVSFAGGMTISVGAYTLPNLKFRRCEREGCFVEGMLPQALIDAMTQSGAANGSVRVQAMNGRKYEFDFQLAGFSDGLALLKQLDIQRSFSGGPVPPKR